MLKNILKPTKNFNTKNPNKYLLGFFNRQTLHLLVMLLLFSFSLFSQKEYKIGDTLPDFKLWFIDGSKLTKKNTSGKIIVFKFWFTSCLPCRIDIPELNELVQEYKTINPFYF